LFTGKIENDKLDFKLLAIVNNRPGRNRQCLAINDYSNKIYLVSDGIFYIMPLDKLKSRTLTKEDCQYVRFKTNREFEGLSFDNKGYAYLLTMRDPEVFKSTTIIWYKDNLLNLFLTIIL